MRKVWVALAALIIAFAGASQAVPAQAHCDALNGPVVIAAQEALAAEDVDLVLPYVQPDAEAEVTAAFEHTLAVRRLGPEAQELADRFFFETVVRLHRLGEGATYTGLKGVMDHGPALEAAEEALASDALDDVFALLDKAMREGVAKKYAAVETARAHAAEEETVTAERERVEAELIFQKYVYDLYTAAEGEIVHAEDAAPEIGNAHGH